MVTEFEIIDNGMFPGDLSADTVREAYRKTNANFGKFQVKTKRVPFTIAFADDKAALAAKINALASVAVGPDERPLFIGDTAPGAENSRHVVIELINKGKGNYGTGGVVLTEADIEIISDRVSESPVVDQDNIAIFRTYFSDNLDYTQADVINIINQGLAFTVTEKQSITFTTFAIQPNEVGIGFTLIKGRNWKMINKGKGTYGTGGTVLTIGDIRYIGEAVPSVEDVQDAGNTETIDLGTIAEGDFLTEANSEVRALTDTETFYLFKYSTDGSTFTLVAFIGAPGTYGGGGTALTEADFQQAASDDAPPAPSVQSVTGDSVDNTDPLNPVVNAVSLEQFEAFEAKDNARYIGDIYNKNTWTDLTDFAASPTATVAVTGGKLAFSGGTNDYTKTLVHDFYTMRDRFTYTVKFIAQEKTATSYGFAINFGRAPLRMVFDMTNGTNSGKVSLLNPSAGVTSATGLSWVANDEISMRFERNGAKVKIALRNETTSSAIVTLNYIFPVSGVNLQNTNRISIASLGGNFTITQLRYNTTEFKNPVATLIGDSKTQLYSATDNYNMWSRRFIEYLGTGNIHAGQGDRTADVLNSLAEVIADTPKNVFLAIGSNDIRNGVAYATYTANYASIVSQLTTAGIKVWHLLPFYEPLVNQVPLRDYIIATYSASDIIDTYTPTICTNGTVDNIHLNDILNNIVYNNVVAANKVTPGKYLPQITESTLADLTALLNDAATKSGTNVFTGLNYFTNSLTQFRNIALETANTYDFGSQAKPVRQGWITDNFLARIKPVTASGTNEFTDFSNNSLFKVFTTTTGNITINSATAQSEKFYVNGSGRFTGPLTLGGVLKVAQYTDGTEPAYVKGDVYFNTTINKLKVGGATAWETVTSS